MKITKLSENKKVGRTDYLIEDAGYVFANTLRRLIIDEVPTMAIEDVEIHKNGSALYDEIIAHRLGLIPLKTDLKYVMPNECTCKGEGCAKCTVTFTLKKKGPATVYAEDLKSSDPKVKPVYPKMIITKLLKDQELVLEAKAVLGQGKDHVKFSPGMAYYRFQPIINIKNGKCENANECAKVCPKKVLEVKSGKLSINKKNEMKCDLCEACTDKCPACIEVKPNEKNIIFSIESWGQLKNKQIFETAIEQMDKKIVELQKLIK